MKTRDPIRAELDRGRTALRDASMSYGVYVAGGSANRSGREAGEDARRRLEAAITDLTKARASLAAALESGTAPGATGAAPDPTKEIHS